MKKELDEKNVEGAVDNGENPVEKMQIICCCSFRVVAPACAVQPREDGERGGEEEEEEVEEETEAKQADVKSMILLGLLLGESVDFYEANDYGNDSAQVQDAVLNLVGLNQKTYCFQFYLFNNFSCVRIFVSIRAKSESNGDGKTAKDDRAPKDDSPTSSAEVESSKEDKRVRL